MNKKLLLLSLCLMLSIYVPAIIAQHHDDYRKEYTQVSIGESIVNPYTAKGADTSAMTIWIVAGKNDCSVCIMAVNNYMHWAMKHSVRLRVAVTSMTANFTKSFCRANGIIGECLDDSKSSISKSLKVKMTPVIVVTDSYNKVVAYDKCGGIFINTDSLDNIYLTLSANHHQVKTGTSNATELRTESEQKSAYTIDLKKSNTKAGLRILHSQPLVDSVGENCILGELNFLEYDSTLRTYYALDVSLKQIVSVKEKGATQIYPFKIHPSEFLLGFWKKAGNYRGTAYDAMIYSFRYHGPPVLYLYSFVQKKIVATAPLDFKKDLAKYNSSIPTDIIDRYQLVMFSASMTSDNKILFGLKHRVPVFGTTYHGYGLYSLDSYSFEKFGGEYVFRDSLLRFPECQEHTLILRGNDTLMFSQCTPVVNVFSPTSKKFDQEYKRHNDCSRTIVPRTERDTLELPTRLYTHTLYKTGDWFGNTLPMISTKPTQVKPQSISMTNDNFSMYISFVEFEGEHQKYKVINVPNQYRVSAYLSPVIHNRRKCSLLRQHNETTYLDLLAIEK